MTKITEYDTLIEDQESVKLDDDFWGDETPKTHVITSVLHPDQQEQTVNILMEWKECRTDPIQYKPYAPLLVPKGVYISIPVPIKYLVEFYLTDEQPETALEAVLTLQGMAFVQGAIADAIENYHSS